VYILCEQVCLGQPAWADMLSLGDGWRRTVSKEKRTVHSNAVLPCLRDIWRLRTKSWFNTAGKQCVCSIYPVPDATTGCYQSASCWEEKSKL